jgi:hypothetical protein
MHAVVWLKQLRENHRIAYIFLISIARQSSLFAQLGQLACPQPACYDHLKLGRTRKAKEAKKAKQP